jgi:hypothetical protein
MGADRWAQLAEMPGEQRDAVLSANFGLDALMKS